jgi:peptidoglycan/xylan/chitin deacetylase (PgdA/CDA1 family)
VLGRAEIATLMYHDVADDPTTSGFQRRGARGYTLTRYAFARHMDEVAADGLAPELIQDVDPSQPGRHLLLTFDDGGASALHVAEELARRNWRAHFFVTAGRIGDRTFLDVNGIRHLHQCGHVLGSHSNSHPDIFRDLAFDDMVREWRTSCDVIAQILGEECALASVPGGDISAEVLRSAGHAGLRALFVSESWLRPRIVQGCWILGRFSVKVGTSRARLRAILQFHTWGWAQFERRLKDVARRRMAPLYREYVRRTTRSYTS